MSTDPRAAYEEVVSEMVITAGATAGQMFGMPCIKAGSKTFAGFWQAAMVFKLGGPEHGEALALAGAHLFDPGMGRPMREWVVVPATHAAQWPALARAAQRYVAGM